PAHGNVRLYSVGFDHQTPTHLYGAVGATGTLVKQAATAPFCGGIAGIACPGLGTCVDNPNDSCDPQHGGADCAGVCECDALAKCAAGNVFDSSPAVCACVPGAN